MLLYCLKCRKNTESKSKKVAKKKTRKNNAFIKMCCVIIKYQNLSKSKKLVDYYLA